jgi:hypothetical protein
VILEVGFLSFFLGGAEEGKKQGSKSCVLGNTQEQVVVEEEEEEEEEKNDGCDLGRMADDGEIDGFGGRSASLMSSVT